MTLSTILDLTPRPTPLLNTSAGLLVKAEALGVAGSHKSRAARYALRQALRDGHISPGGHKRIIEKTGGNFGLGLAYYAGRVDIGVDLVIGKSFSPIKRKMCGDFGARVVGQDDIDAGLSPKQVIAGICEKDPDKYFFLDQFNNNSNLQAHLEETGPELVRQLRDMGLSKSAELFFVAGAGTGASISGIATALREAFPLARCFLAYPDVCHPPSGRYEDHPIEGVAVGVPPPFLNESLIADIIAVSPERAIQGQGLSARTLGIYCGLSSGMNMWSANSLSESNPLATIVTIIYDTGDAYVRTPTQMLET